ncbi:uncharacterized protein A4U43_C04F4790 [Asparagus officinalis]|uniref:Uncharacterized protein n=1 Tax=Asparagus officinalis TaxID=4686 RepID=A0A5P1F119_ASPOF|nr:uncharacterized protein A4U43_C04F4790 [Asparagus officinalis]
MMMVSFVLVLIAAWSQPWFGLRFGWLLYWSRLCWIFVLDNCVGYSMFGFSCVGYDLGFNQCLIIYVCLAFGFSCVQTELNFQQYSVVYLPANILCATIFVVNILSYMGGNHTMVTTIKFF